jgi:hypothetical protein
MSHDRQLDSTLSALRPGPVFSTGGGAVHGGPSTESALNRAISELAHVVSIAQSNTSRLESDLGPVLLPEPPALRGNDGMEAAEPLCCPVVDRINHIRREAMVMVKRQELIAARLQV